MVLCFETFAIVFDTLTLHDQQNPLCTELRCYIPIYPTQDISWDDAQNMCQRSAAELVSINSYEELELLQLLLLRLMPIKTDSIFIGLIKKEVSGGNPVRRNIFPIDLLDNVFQSIRRGVSQR